MLPPEQIALIKVQVAQLAEASELPSRLQTPPAQVPPPAPVAAALLPTQQQPSLSSLLGPGALAALLERQSTTPQPAPPTQSVAPARSPHLSHVQPSYTNLTSAAPSSTHIPDPNSLLEKLRAAGMLPAVPSTTSAPPPLNAPPAVGSLPPGILPPFTTTPLSATRTPQPDNSNDIVLKPTSLKM